MTDSHFQEAVAIDTNVFQHLLNPQNNVNYHINRLLEYLISQRVTLIVDKQGNIAGKYDQQLKRRLGQSNEKRNEIQILRYWVLFAPRHEVPVDENGVLMSRIGQVIVEVSEDVDRIFVYVAFQQGRVLISNDMRHIVRGPADESPKRRVRLLDTTVGLRPDGADILTSQEASAMI